MYYQTKSENRTLLKLNDIIRIEIDDVNGTTINYWLGSSTEEGYDLEYVSTRERDKDFDSICFIYNNTIFENS